jgi:hypothetical protein
MNAGIIEIFELPSVTAISDGHYSVFERKPVPDLIRDGDRFA